MESSDGILTKTDRRPLIAAIVGVGQRGQNLLRAVPAATGVELKWLCDEDPQLLGRIGRDRPGCARTGTVDFLLEDGELDVILIAGTPTAQLDLATEALAAGKHVFLDEPAPLSASALDRLDRLARDNRLTVACGNSFLHSSPVRAIKDIVDTGKIGELFFVSSSRLEPGREAGPLSRGVRQSHFAMLLHWLGERPRTVKAVHAPAGGATPSSVTVVTLTFASGLAATVELGAQRDGPSGRTVLVGSERMAVYDENDAQTVSTMEHGVVHKASQDAAEYRVSYGLADVIPAAPAGLEPLERSLEDFEMAIRNRKDALASSRLVKNATRVLEAGGESLRRGGAEVSVGASRRLLRGQVRRRMAIG
jgi:predicted dehydrogenase